MTPSVGGSSVENTSVPSIVSRVLMSGGSARSTFAISRIENRVVTKATGSSDVPFGGYTGLNAANPRPARTKSTAGVNTVLRVARARTSAARRTGSLMMSNPRTAVRDPVAGHTATTGT